jgi:hypothetical protein
MTEYRVQAPEAGMLICVGTHCPEHPVAPSEADTSDTPHASRKPEQFAASSIVERDCVVAIRTPQDEDEIASVIVCDGDRPTPVGNLGA